VASTISLSSQSSSSSLTRPLSLGSVDPAASTTCDALLSHALQIDPQHLEALQTLASVRLSQQNQTRLCSRFGPSHRLRSKTTRTRRRPTRDLMHTSYSTRYPSRRASRVQSCSWSVALTHPDARSLLEGVVETDDSIIEGTQIYH
ncbi:hypothetical protein L210DRAFT_3592476, partial [Boletus edulis BED1]